MVEVRLDGIADGIPLETEVALQISPKMEGAMEPRWTIWQLSSWRRRFHVTERDLRLEPWLSEHLRLCPPFEIHSTHHFCWNPQWTPRTQKNPFSDHI